MPKAKIPTPPYTPRTGTHALVQEGFAVCYIWVFDAEGLRSIGTQYASARQIMQEKGVSKTTAYRYIRAHRKRYWCTEMLPDREPRCYMVLPASALEAIVPQPVGNPNMKNGIYQQEIARKRIR